MVSESKYQAHGWLNVDKPAGIGSTRVVETVRHTLSVAKVGHAGTLDPFASGVLPIAVGEARKTVRYLMEAAKSYRFTVRWGEQRTTDDPEGEVTVRSNTRPTREAIEAALPAFVGTISQVPPIYSAIKVGGRRAYDLARAGADVTLEARQVRIDSLELEAQADHDHASFVVNCGKGAYMRALARDLAAHLGTCGHVAALRRVRVGVFDEASAISLEKLVELGHSARANLPLLPIAAALSDVPVLAVTDDEALRLRHGMAVPVLRPGERRRMEDLGDDHVVLALSGMRPVALARIDGIQIRPVRVLNI